MNGPAHVHCGVGTQGHAQSRELCIESRDGQQLLLLGEALGRRLLDVDGLVLLSRLHLCGRRDMRLAAAPVAALLVGHGVVQTGSPSWLVG